jgi:hypothetical protein
MMIVASLAFTATASAQPQRNISAYGVGTSSCASFLRTTDSTPGSSRSLAYPNGQTWFSENRLYAEWIMGFITAMNAVYENQIHTDGPGFDLWLRNWCQEHPANSVHWAVAEFVRAMHAR